MLHFLKSDFLTDGDTMIGEHWSNDLVSPPERVSVSEITPPHSPLLEEELLDQYSDGAMVNPNVVLNCYSKTAPSSNMMIMSSSSSPDLSTYDENSLRQESWEPFLNEYSLLDNLCDHGNNNVYCEDCYNDNIKTDVLNDFMLSASSDLKETFSIYMQDNDYTSSRSRLDSISSRYSEVDPMAGVIANNVDSVEFSTPLPETPSDTDTDTDEPSPSVETVHMEHNYYFTSNRHKTIIGSPLIKALDEVSANQEVDSDGYDDDDDDDDDDDITIDDDIDIDVVPDNSCHQVTPSSTNSAPVNSLRMLRTAPNTATPVDNVVRMPARRGRKPGSTNGPRKVGRPPKNVKRLINMEIPSRKPAARRSGVRAIQMDPAKRAAHNCMERQRRVNLKCDFEHLCSLVPELTECMQNGTKKKPPAKVTILSKATYYVYELEHKITKQVKEAEEIANNNRILAEKVRRLSKEMGIKVEFG